MLIGGQDMVLPTTMVGNYPNPRWYDGHGFATLPKGEFIHDSISKEAFEDVVGAIVRDQESAGLDVISDGKVYGGDSPYGTILYYYLERMSGYRLSDGKSVFSVPTAPVDTDFPSLSASGSLLVVPEGDTVVSYLGI